MTVIGGVVDHSAIVSQARCACSIAALWSLGPIRCVMMYAGCSCRVNWRVVGS
jgi:hypothetical protein